jgi:hypothetical protein
MDNREIDLPEGSLTVRVPGGTVTITTNLVETGSREPCTVVEVASHHKNNPDRDGRVWTVDEPRTYAKPGKVVMRSRNTGALHIRTRNDF